MTRHDAGFAVPATELEVLRCELEDIEIRKSIANFRGSFVGEHILVPPMSGPPLRRNSTFRDHILAGGWRDAGVWKSAVSRRALSFEIEESLKAFSSWR